MSKFEIFNDLIKGQLLNIEFILRTLEVMKLETSSNSKEEQSLNTDSILITLEV